MKKSWHKFQQYYFSFNRSDRNAITILSSAIFILLVSTEFLPYLIPRQKTDFTEIKVLFENWENEQAETELDEALQLFMFDPNTIPSSELDGLDLPEFVKQNIIRYREAGGQFETDNDLHKIYGMTDSVFQVIQPYIQIRSAENPKEKLASSYVKSQMNLAPKVPVDSKSEPESTTANQIILELNTADSTDLIQLPGIGPVFSKRIIRYRDLLGGFAAKEQLLEVYNFPEETYENIMENIQVDSTKIQKLRINFIGYSDLLRHPYLNKEQVQAILHQRDTKGPFKNLSEVASIQVFDSESFARVRPYLTCD